MKKSLFIYPVAASVMKKSIFLLALLLPVLSACSKKEGTFLNDAIEKEAVVIEGIIKKHGLKVLTEYPPNGQFGKNEYVILEDGVYLNIIKPGNDKRPYPGSIIETVAKGEIYEANGPRLFDGYSKSSEATKWPLRFSYNHNLVHFENDILLSHGCTDVMKYLGDSAVVSMIVPFLSGSVHQQSTLLPIFYQEATFVIAKEKAVSE